MDIPKIFDREIERANIADIIKSDGNETLIISGPSGCGKTFLLDHVIANLKMTDRTIHFSFKPGYLSKAETLNDYLYRTYMTGRSEFFSRSTALKFKDIRVGTSGASVAYERVSDKMFDENMVEHLFEKLASSGVRILRITNAEWCFDKHDAELLAVLSGRQDSRLRVLIEIGTLHEDNHKFIYRLIARSLSGRTIQVKPFGPTKTVSFFTFLNGVAPTSNIYERTKGLPLAVRHVGPEDESEDEYWVYSKYSKLTKRQNYIVFVIATIGDPISLSLLEFITGMDELDVQILDMTEKNVLVDDEFGVSFAHPTFAVHAVEKLRKGSREKILRRYLEYLKGVADQRSIAIERLRLARELGDPTEVGTAFRSALLAITKREEILNTLAVFDAIAALPRLQPLAFARLLMLKAQFLLMNYDTEAARDTVSKIRSNVLSTKSSIDQYLLLKSIVLHYENDFTASLATVEQLVERLEGRDLIIALSLIVANLVPLQDGDRAVEIYTSALYYCESHAGNVDLYEEVARLEAKIAPDKTAAIERMQDFLAAHDWQSPLNRAKYEHNIGVQRLLHGQLHGGLDQIVRAQEVLDREKLSVASYCAASRAVALIGLDKLGEATDLLLDALCICRGGYDEIVIHSNLAALYLLRNMSDRAVRHVSLAVERLEDPVRPFRDPIVASNVYLNASMSAGRRGDWPTAKRLLEKIPELSFVDHNDRRLRRLSRVWESLSAMDATVALDLGSPRAAGWHIDTFNVGLTTLSFYDFPVAIFGSHEIGELTGSL
jgi:tetratricopeptide (TPR) repeat protein